MLSYLAISLFCNAGFDLLWLNWIWSVSSHRAAILVLLLSSLGLAKVRSLEEVLNRGCYFLFKTSKMFLFKFLVVSLDLTIAGALTSSALPAFYVLLFVKTPANSPGQLLPLFCSFLRPVLTSFLFSLDLVGPLYVLWSKNYYYFTSK
jgi:hypothetical protein